MEEQQKSTKFMKSRFFDFVIDELAWLDELIPISFHRGAACDTHRFQILHLEPILAGPFCRAHVQLLGAWESISSIHVLAPAVFRASDHVQATTAERLRASLRVLPAETMVDGLPRARSCTLNPFWLARSCEVRLLQ